MSEEPPSGCVLVVWAFLLILMIVFVGWLDIQRNKPKVYEVKIIRTYSK